VISITAQTTSIKYTELVAYFNEPMLLGSIFLFILVVRPIIQIGAYLAFAGNGSGV